MQRWQRPIYNGTLEALMWKIYRGFLWLEKRLLPLVSTLLLINKNAQVAFAEKSQKNKQIEETKL